jgi:hypothetical protein
LRKFNASFRRQLEILGTVQSRLRTLRALKTKLGEAVAGKEQFDMGGLLLTPLDSKQVLQDRNRRERPCKSAWR